MKVEVDKKEAKGADKATIVAALAAGALTSLVGGLFLGRCLGNFTNGK